MTFDMHIRVTNIGKEYSIGRRRSYRTLSEVLSRLVRSPLSIIGRNRNSKNRSFFKRQRVEKFWALRDVSFSIEPGEVVGIIGRNGAGKSTLLRILARITNPTEGVAEINGRMGSLLEVGTGFHPELTGRENIILNGAILGMKRQEVKRKMEQIINFAEMERFIETPVKRYSSGMYMRLAFSVAAHLEPDILVVDEVLAVGDALFQKKCLGKMHDIADTGRTVLFVSHNMAAVRNLCTRGILLEQGKMVFDGDPAGCIEKYLGATGETKDSSVVRYLPSNDLPAMIHLAQIDPLENSGHELELTKPFCIDVEIEIKKKLESLYLGVCLRDKEENIIIFFRDHEIMPRLTETRYPGLYKYTIQIPENILVPGSYSLELALVSRKLGRPIHRPEGRLGFTIVDSISARSVSGLPWNSITAVVPKLSYKKL